MRTLCSFAYFRSSMSKERLLTIFRAALTSSFTLYLWKGGRETKGVTFAYDKSPVYNKTINQKTVIKNYYYQYINYFGEKEKNCFLIFFKTSNQGSNLISRACLFLENNHVCLVIKISLFLLYLYVITTFSKSQVLFSIFFKKIIFFLKQ